MNLYIGNTDPLIKDQGYIQELALAFSLLSPRLPELFSTVFF